VKAAWYEKQGPAREVLVVGEMADPVPAAGEVRLRVHASGINPGDVKKREDTFALGMSYPRVIPHSDGAGVVDQVGEGVDASWVGRRVWCFGAQSYRPFGTAAELCVMPVEKIAPLPEGVSFEQGACLGIPGITGHRAVFVNGPVTGKVVLVQGASGAVGQCAVALARLGNAARVLGTVRSKEDLEVAQTAGAHAVVLTGDKLAARLREFAPDGVDHVVEVAFGANAAVDVELLRDGGSIATYATNDPGAAVPFWQMVFKNVSVSFLGSDDFPASAKTAATLDLNHALVAGWPGFAIAERLPLDEVARAQELVEKPRGAGRVVVVI
jgi:NADPH:quinone reductase